MRRSYALWSTLVAAGFTLGACSYDRYPAREPSQAVSDSQGRLSGLGYYSGPLDGMWNPNTEAAIARFQHDRGLTATAQLDDTTWASLREASAKNAIDVNDASDVSALQSRLAQLGYYDGPLTGAPDTATQTALERFQRSRGLPPGPMTAMTATAMGLDARDLSEKTTAVATAPSATIVVTDRPASPAVRSVQGRLKTLGLYRGPVDGVWSGETESAVSAFQRSRGLEADGALTPTTVSMLGLNPNILRSSVATYRR